MFLHVSFVFMEATSIHVRMKCTVSHLFTNRSNGGIITSFFDVCIILKILILIPLVILYFDSSATAAQGAVLISNVLSDTINITKSSFSGNISPNIGGGTF